MKFCSFMVGGILLEMAMCGSALSMNIQDGDVRAHQIVNRHGGVWGLYDPVDAVFRHIVPGYSLFDVEHLCKIAKEPRGRDALVAYTRGPINPLLRLDCLDVALGRIGGSFKWDNALDNIVQDPTGVEALGVYARNATFGTESIQRKLVAIASMQSPADREDIDEVIAAATHTLLSRHGYGFNDGVLTAPAAPAPAAPAPAALAPAEPAPAALAPAALALAEPAPAAPAPTEPASAALAPAEPASVESAGSAESTQDAKPATGSSEDWADDKVDDVDAETYVMK